MNRSQHHDTHVPLQIKPDEAGICVLDIKKLDLEVTMKPGVVNSYQIIPQPGLTLIGSPNPNYSPFITGKVDQNGMLVKRVAGTSLP